MPDDLLDLSLNEVETLAQKAARGAGLPWGVAEDTGRAAAWIARRTDDWAGALLALLEAPPPAEASPLLLAGPLADDPAAWTPRRIVAPLWALPGLLATARRPLALRLDGAEIRCNPGEAPGATLPAAALAALPAALVTLHFSAGPALAHRLAPELRRSAVARALWRRLDALAGRTYVPASDRSRLTGAGAGILDDE